jgi:medium-chain acyl-[acyl-carrier-protein] hydrolase
MTVGSQTSQPLRPRRVDLLTCRQPLEAPRVRLICFAHAGGGDSAYRAWPAALRPSIEVWTASLPGRAWGTPEPFADSWPPLVERLADSLEPSAGESALAFFGHSLGALVAFELARTLERRHGEGPVHLFVSASKAPHRPPGRQPLPADDDELVNAMDEAYGGVPPEVLAEPELLKRFVGILRADLELLEAHRWEPGEPLACPITAIAGEADEHALPADIDHWRDLTQRGFDSVALPGGHFAIHAELTRVADLIRRALAPEPAHSSP